MWDMVENIRNKTMGSMMDSNTNGCKHSTTYPLEKPIMMNSNLFLELVGKSPFHDSKLDSEGLPK
jgi:hypothetical protein